jgi:hypothetical protein
MTSHAATPAPSRLAPARGLSRPRGGSLRSGAQSAAFAALFVSGLWLWLWPGAALVLWLHLAGGAVFAAALLPWLLRHVPRGLALSQRAVFTQGAWALLAIWLILLASGLVMALPVALWATGLVWFPPREVTEALSFAHFWSAWLAALGLVVHLGMRHWVRRQR